MKSEAVRWVLLVVLVVGASAEKWKFPEGSSSVRIDTKVQFIDGDRQAAKNQGSSDVQADESAPFQPARDTTGFYNRPVDAPGRYPVRVATHDAYRAPPGRFYSDGTVDSLMHCKCLSNPECSSSQDSSKVCGPGKFLCCAKRPNKGYPNPEFFNEVDDERPDLYPGQGHVAGPFPPPPDAAYNFDRNSGYQQQPALVRPGGPTGNNGPNNKQVLVGPDGPTGIVGPATHNNNPGVLVGPGGPTGIIGPGPLNNQDDRYTTRDVGTSESAQRGILVGPGGPTGIIGPAGYGRRPVLTGPGGPTGIIGPYGYGGRQMNNPGILVGPGGPTGIIGPGRQILVGPGGPTGHIGPRRPFYYGK